MLLVPSNSRILTITQPLIDPFHSTLLLNPSFVGGTPFVPFGAEVGANTMEERSMSNYHQQQEQTQHDEEGEEEKQQQKLDDDPDADAQEQGLDAPSYAISATSRISPSNSIPSHMPPSKRGSMVIPRMIPSVGEDANTTPPRSLSPPASFTNDGHHIRVMASSDDPGNDHNDDDNDSDSNNKDAAILQTSITDNATFDYHQQQEQLQKDEEEEQQQQQQDPEVPPSRSSSLPPSKRGSMVLPRMNATTTNPFNIPTIGLTNDPVNGSNDDNDADADEDDANDMTVDSNSQPHQQPFVQPSFDPSSMSTSIQPSTITPLFQQPLPSSSIPIELQPSTPPESTDQLPHVEQLLDIEQSPPATQIPFFLQPPPLEEVPSALVNKNDGIAGMPSPHDINNMEETPAEDELRSVGSYSDTDTPSEISAPVASVAIPKAFISNGYVMSEVDRDDDDDEPILSEYRGPNHQSPHHSTIPLSPFPPNITGTGTTATAAGVPSVVTSPFPKLKKSKSLRLLIPTPGDHTNDGLSH